MSAEAQPQGRLATNIVYFARALRAAGIPVGPGAVIDALAAVTAAGVGIERGHDFLRSVSRLTGLPSSSQFAATFLVGCTRGGSPGIFGVPSCC